VIESGIVGRLVAVTGAAMFRKPDAYFDDGPWRRLGGGGPLLINMIHEIDSLRYLCGEITSVQALASSSVRGFEVEDTVAISLAFANGALGTFMLSDTAASAVSWELTSGDNPAYPNVAGVDCYVLAGDVGSLSVPTMRLTSYEGTPSWWEPLRSEVVDVDRRDPLAEQIAHFCAVIRGDAAPLVTGWDGVQNLVVAEAIVEAWRSGSVVPTPDPRAATEGPEGRAYRCRAPRGLGGELDGQAARPLAAAPSYATRRNPRCPRSCPGRPARASPSWLAGRPDVHEAVPATVLSYGLCGGRRRSRPRSPRPRSGRTSRPACPRTGTR
jgi:hypothetical protein